MRRLQRLVTASCVLALLVVSEAQAKLPKPDDVRTLQGKLAGARRALETPDSSVEPADRAVLVDKLTAAQQSLASFIELSNQHSKRQGAAPLYALAGVLAADDATGIGTVDDPLLVLVGLAILVTSVEGALAPSTPEIEAAWGDVQMRVQALSDAAREASARQKKPGCACRCYTKGFGPLDRGRQPNAAVCKRICEREKYSGYRCGSGEVVWF